MVSSSWKSTVTLKLCKKKTQVKIVPFKLDELEKIQRREKSFHKVRYPMMQIMNFKATTHETCRVDVA